MYSAIDLQEFPFDTQALKVEFTSFRYDNNDVILEGRETSTGRMQDIRIPGWDLINNFNNSIQPIKSLSERKHSRLNHVITIKRRAGYYIWNYVVPLCLIVLMASSVFWIDPEAFGPQIGISTASVFTLVAFLLGL